MTQGLQPVLALALIGCSDDLSRADAAEAFGERLRADPVELSVSVGEYRKACSLVQAEFAQRSGRIVSGDDVYAMEQKELKPFVVRDLVTFADTLVLDPGTMRLVPGCHLRHAGALAHGWTMATSTKQDNPSDSSLIHERKLKSFPPRIVASVTGITRGDEGRAVVVFMWRADSTEAMRLMLPIWLLPSGDGAARFRRFNDG